MSTFLNIFLKKVDFRLLYRCTCAIITRLHKQHGSAELPLANGYMSVNQISLVVKSNLLSILTPAKVVKIFESQNINTKNPSFHKFCSKSAANCMKIRQINFFAIFLELFELFYSLLKKYHYLCAKLGILRILFT